MAQVEISINGQAYRISCEDGQEQRLSELAQMVGAHVGDLVQQVCQVGQTRLLVMASLLVADELVDLREAASEVMEDVSDNDPSRAIEVMGRVSSRLEAIADRLDRV